jgi:hypothetical protein
LFSNLNGVVQLSTWARWLLRNWSALLQYFWDTVLLFKIDVSAYDAEFLTIFFLMIGGIFYSASSRHQNSALRGSPFYLLIALGLILGIQLIGIYKISDKNFLKS